MNSCLLHWQVDSLQLSHQGSPTECQSKTWNINFVPVIFLSFRGLQSKLISFFFPPVSLPHLNNYFCFLFNHLPSFFAEEGRGFYHINFQGSLFCLICYHIRYQKLFYWEKKTSFYLFMALCFLVHTRHLERKMSCNVIIYTNRILYNNKWQ